MNPYHFLRSFKQTTGTTPHRFVLRLRVERAQALLADTELSVTEIAYRTGFGSHSNFVRAFRQHTGASPSVYRQRKL